MVFMDDDRFDSRLSRFLVPANLLRVREAHHHSHPLAWGRSICPTDPHGYQHHAITVALETCPWRGMDKAPLERVRQLEAQIAMAAISWRGRAQVNDIGRAEIMIIMMVLMMVMVIE